MTKLWFKSRVTRASSHLYESAMRAALQAAWRFLGATAPNPAVGAAALSQSGEMIAVGAHERAGRDHAEVQVLRRCSAMGRLSEVHTLVVTLEPCHHQGRTPPCTRAIDELGIRQVVFGVRDPNTDVVRSGAEFLRSRGLEVEEGVLQHDCEKLIRDFFYSCRERKPWVTLKIARRADGSMIPFPGQKTFTSKQALKISHFLRRSCDTIITGSGTILADRPLLSVRNWEDHAEFKRRLVLVDRRKRLIDSDLEPYRNGFELWHEDRPLNRILSSVYEDGARRILIEAGPELSQAFEKAGLWNEKFEITQTEDEREILKISFHDSKFDGAEFEIGSSDLDFDTVAEMVAATRAPTYE